VSAFLQCGILDGTKEASIIESDVIETNESYNMKKAELDSIKSEYESKIKEMEKTVFEKEDHFDREMEILKSRNKKLVNELDMLKMQSELAELNGDSSDNNQEDKVSHMENELNMCNQELQKIMTEKVESEVKATILNESIARLKSQLKEKEKEVNEFRQVENLLNESLELEKKNVEMTKNEKEELEVELESLKDSLEHKVKRATKQQNLELELLKSELERTKLKLKEAQETSIKVYEDLFVEHEEMLETVKSLSSRKRKQFFEDIYHQTKKLKELDDETDLLSESIIVAGVTEDPKEDLTVPTTISKSDTGLLPEPYFIEKPEVSDEKFYVEKLDNKEVFSTESLLTSTPSASKTTTSVLFASWQNSGNTELDTDAMNFYKPMLQDSNIDDLFDSYA